MTVVFRTLEYCNVNGTISTSEGKVLRGKCVLMIKWHLQVKLQYRWMTGLRNKNSRGDRLCAQRKNKTQKTNKRKTGTAGINKTNKMMKLSTKEKILQDNSWNKIHNFLIIWCLNRPDHLKNVRLSYISPKICQIYIRNKHFNTFNINKTWLADVTGANMTF